MSEPVRIVDTGFEEIEYEELKSGSCIIGDCICYHAQAPREFSEYIAKQIHDSMAREQIPILHFVGMGRGYIQSALARMLPDGVRLVCWDEHPNLSKRIVPEPDRQLIDKRWIVVNEAEQFIKCVEEEGNGAKRTIALQPGLNEPMHWTLGFIDWMKRNRKHFRGMQPLSMIPSPRSIFRISQFGRIPGVHQLDKLGGRDAIVVSCGPSLTDESAKAIRLMVQRGAVVFSAGQAVRKLNDFGIVPHFAVVADPSDIMYEQMRDKRFEQVKDAQFGLVIAESMSSELFVNHMADKLVHFNIMSSHCHQAASDMLGWPAFDDSFATVTEIATCMARIMNANRVFMVGCDFAAPPEMKTNPFPEYQSSFRMPTYDGRLCWTNAHYNHARRWMESHLAHELYKKDGIHRHSVGLPVKGEMRYSDPMGMVAAVHTMAPFKMPRAPKARESDILPAATILNYLRKRGYDAGDAANPEHPDDFKYAFMGSSHERKQTLIDLALGRMIGTDALDKKSSVEGATAPVESAGV